MAEEQSSRSTDARGGAAAAPVISSSPLSTIPIESERTIEERSTMPRRGSRSVNNDMGIHIVPIPPLPTAPSGSNNLMVMTTGDVMDIAKEGRKAVRQFLQRHTCYQIIKNSAKVVVFDVKIPVNLAFFALIEHDIKSAPLWDADLGHFVGMLTATDLVNVLIHYYIRGSPMSELAEHSIASWRAMPKKILSTEAAFHVAPVPKSLITISPEASLFDAITELVTSRVHRIPVLDPKQNSVLTLMTYRGILEYLVTSFREQRRLFDQSVSSLGIGTFGADAVVTVPEDMPLIRVLHTIVERRISAVPVISATGAVVDVYAVSDVTQLAKDSAIGKLDLAVGDVLKMHAQEGVSGEGLHVCAETDTLHMIFEKLAAVKAHRLFCLDNENRCIGVVALHDLFKYFLAQDD